MRILLRLLLRVLQLLVLAQLLLLYHCLCLQLCQSAYRPRQHPTTAPALRHPQHTLQHHRRSYAQVLVQYVLTLRQTPW